MPNLGVVKKPDGDGFVVADIPGLIEGASEGVGLGYEFLRHVQRCRFFVHIVDMNEQNPLENYLKINSELKKYDEELVGRHQVLVLNKADIVDEDKIVDLVAKFKAYDDDLFVISAATKDGVKELLNHLYELVKQIPSHPPVVDVEEDTEFNNNDDSQYFVTKLNKNTFAVQGGKLKRLVNVTDIKNIQQMRRLSNIMDSMGIWAELKSMGIQNEDTVVVEGVEMIYTDEYYFD